MKSSALNTTQYITATYFWLAHHVHTRPGYRQKLIWADCFTFLITPVAMLPNVRLTDYLYILATILFTVYGQIVIKWQVLATGRFPSSIIERIWFLARLVINPWVASGFVAAFVASLCWMAAMTRFRLSDAYPFTGLSFALVLLLSMIFFRENITLIKMLGVGLIALGVFVASRG